MIRHWASWLGLCLLLLVPPAIAQDSGVPQAPVLTVDSDRLFSASAFGRRVASELEAASRALAIENREIEQALEAEELDLTRRRAELPPEEFTALADAFDEKVERLRDEQDAKGRALNLRSEEVRSEFLNFALPVLAGIVRDAGAVAILERRQIFLAVDAIDVTDLAIERLDHQLGDGRQPPSEDDSPD